MCTVVVLYRPDDPWPVILAANRDEMAERPARPPNRHWPDRPHVVAGLDVLAGGTWLGLNDDGVVACVLNRLRTLGPAPGLRSRGELPFIALAHRTAADAAEALTAVDAAAYRPFNMVVADSRGAFWMRAGGKADDDGPGAAGSLEVTAVPAGLSMITAYDRNDPASPRIHRYLPEFLSAPAPQPDSGEWTAWQTLLASREHDPDAGPGGAMTVVTETGFGTVSSSLLALPDAEGTPPPVWLYAAGRPGNAPYVPVNA